MARSYLQGKYRPQRPERYVGDPNNIVFRSSWELAAFKYIEAMPDIILRWSSETSVIPYVCGTDGKLHRYFVDLTLWVKQQDNTVKKFLVEIKPYAQTIRPKRTSRKAEKTYITEVETYVKNQSKWAAAEQWCTENNAKFIKWTERDLMCFLEGPAKMPRSKKKAR